MDINEHPVVLAAMQRDPGRGLDDTELGALRAIRDGLEMPEQVLDADISWLGLYGFIATLQVRAYGQQYRHMLTRRGEEALAADERGAVGT